MAILAIEARRLGSEQTGIGHYLRWCLSDLLAHTPPGDRVVLYAFRKVKFSTPNHAIMRTGRFTFLPNTVWIHTEIPLWSRLDRIDSLWCPAQIAPFFMPERVKIILTVHDLIPIIAPHLSSRLYRWYMGHLIPSSVRKAQHVFTISHASKRDLVEHMGVKEENITVVYPPIPPHFKPHNMEESRHYVKRKLGVSKPFFLFVGRFEPRKNLTGIIEAMKLIRDRRGELPFSLIAVGNKGWRTEEILKEANVLGNDFIPAFNVKSELLLALYSSCVALVLPSFYEGFGLPLAEAMACGSPVITSNISACPEVAGEAGIIINPREPEEIAGAMETLIDNKHLRDSLASKALHRIAEIRQSAKGFGRRLWEVVHEKA